jgi:hypothetical protein
LKEKKKQTKENGKQVPQDKVKIHFKNMEDEIVQQAKHGAVEQEVEHCHWTNSESIPEP